MKKTRLFLSIRESIQYIKNFLLVTTLFISLFTSMNSFGQSIYLNVDYSAAVNGTGDILSPFNDVSHAVYQANVLYPDKNVFIEIEGTPTNALYLQFENRVGEISISGVGSGIYTPSSNSENFQMVIIAPNTKLTIKNFNFNTTSGNQLFGLFLNNISGPVSVENCSFTSMAYPGLTAADFSTVPLRSEDYFYPIYASGSASNLTVTGTIFNRINVGFGTLIKTAVGLYDDSTLITNGSDSFGNEAIEIYAPFNAALATEFYVDNTVVAGETGYGGDGSESRPWKYLTSANFGAIFNDWSTDPPTFVNKDVTIYFKAGTHMLQNSIYMSDIPATSSLVLKPATGAEDAVTLDGSGITGQWESIIACSNCNNVTVEGLKLKNLTCNQSFDMDTRFGIIFNGSGSNIKIIDNLITDMHWSNNATDKLNPLPTNNLGAIQVLGTSSTPITDVSINRNIVNNITPGWTEAITVNGNVDGFEINDNTVSHIANIGIVAAGNYEWVLTQEGSTVSASDNHSKNGIISGNSVSTCISPIAVSAGIYVDGATNITVSNNTSFSNGAGISVGHEQYNGTSGGHTVINNTFSGNIDAGMYFGSTNSTSMVQGLSVSGNISQNNYNNNAALLAKTNGNYGGGEKHAEVKIYRVTDLNFTDNEITSDSDVVMIKDFYGMHTGNHSYSSNTYNTISDNPSLAQFVYADSGNTGSWTPYDFCEHQAEGYDLDSTLGGGNCDDINSGGTGLYTFSEVEITDTHDTSMTAVVELTAINSEIEISDIHSLTDIHASLSDKGYYVSHSFDDYTYNVSGGEVHFLAPDSYVVDGFPSTHPAFGKNASRVLASAATFKSNGTNITTMGLYKMNVDNGTAITVDTYHSGHPDDGDLVQHNHNTFMMVSHKIEWAIRDLFNSVSVTLDQSFALYDKASQFYVNVQNKAECGTRSIFGGQRDLLLLSECILDQSLTSNPAIQIVIKDGGRLVLATTDGVFNAIKNLLPPDFAIQAMNYFNKPCPLEFIDEQSADNGSGAGNCYQQSLTSGAAISYYIIHHIGGSSQQLKNDVVIDLSMSAAKVLGIMAFGMTVTGYNGNSDENSCTEVSNALIASPLLITNTSPDVYKYTNIPADGSLANVLTSKPYIVSHVGQETNYVIPTYSTTTINATTNIVWEFKGDTCELQQKEILNSNNNTGLPFVIGIESTEDPKQITEMGWELYVHNGETVSIPDPFTSDGFLFGSQKQLILYSMTFGITNPFISNVPKNARVWGSTDLRTISNYNLTYSAKNIRQEESILNQTIPPEILIYPNPTSDQLTIKLGDKITGQIEIFNINGSKIEQLNYTEENNDSGLQANMRAYIEGLYIVKVTTATNVYTEKLVKQ